MRLPVIATLALATILSVGIAAPAYAADTVSYVDYSLDASDSQYTGGNFVDGAVSTECAMAPGADLRYYTVEPFHVDVAGDYAPIDRVWTPTGGLLGDGALAIYTAGPDAGDLEASCLFGTDDGIGRTVALDVNTTYYLFQSTSAPAVVGSFGFDVSGPGSLVLGAYVPAATSTTLSADPASAVVGAPIGLTATVTGTDPTGGVEFFADGSSLGTAATSSGIATFSVSTLAVGSHAITASYAGDATNAASTATALSVAVTAAPVIPAATTTTLSTSAVSAEAGTAIEFTATVTGTGPTGDVEFFTGATSLGTAATSIGVATLSTTTLAVGDHQITARYAGDANNESSTSGVITVTVTAAAVVPGETTTALRASASSAAVGTAIEFTATVTGTGPTGDVEFFAGATSLGTAATSIGVATLSTTTLAVGDHQITARYAGDANNAPSSTTAITITVSAAAMPTPSVPPTTTTPSATPTAALPATGSNPLPAGLAALLLLAFGGAMLLTRVRRTGAAA